MEESLSGEHIEARELIAWLEKRIAPDREEIVEKHLRDCDDCRQRAIEAKAADALSDTDEFARLAVERLEEKARQDPSAESRVEALVEHLRHSKGRRRQSILALEAWSRLRRRRQDIDGALELQREAAQLREGTSDRGEDYLAAINELAGLYLEKGDSEEADVWIAKAEAALDRLQPAQQLHTPPTNAHVGKADLILYYEGELSAVEAGRIAAHLDACPACREKSGRIKQPAAVVESGPKYWHRALPIAAALVLGFALGIAVLSWPSVTPPAIRAGAQVYDLFPADFVRRDPQVRITQIPTDVSAVVLLNGLTLTGEAASFDVAVRDREERRTYYKKPLVLDQNGSGWVIFEEASLSPGDYWVIVSQNGEIVARFPFAVVP
ncbi:MAG TPA: zf-HC2 domain-containing protein [Acidobacteriota bacterium]|nr:zf-HC2 domain-containing protein [Acidobacteriota bacterium]